MAGRSGGRFPARHDRRLLIREARPRGVCWTIRGTFDLGCLCRLRGVYSRGTSPALTDPSVRQWLAKAVFLHTAQRRRSFAKANRASQLSGCPGQLGSDGQARGISRSCQRDLRSKVTSPSCSIGCSAGKRTPLIWCAAPNAAFADLAWFSAASRYFGVSAAPIRVDHTATRFGRRSNSSIVIRSFRALPLL
jgi:hypothetical protein